MNVLITGGTGQLGCSLRQTAPVDLCVAALDRVKADITDPEAIKEVFARVKPDIVINTAAFTAVDKAEEEPQRAYQVNAEGVNVLLNLTKEWDARLIHVSTDYVFDGEGAFPYRAYDSPQPRSVYGASKLTGERNALSTLPESSVIIRTAWLYSVFGRNFVKTMLRLMQSRNEISVVCDQVGSPTWATSLAEVIWKMVRRPSLTGVFHWTDQGEVSWYEFALAIQEHALTVGLLDRPVTVNKVTASEFGGAAHRPKYSVLDCRDTCEILNYPQTSWKVNLHYMLNELQHDA